MQCDIPLKVTFCIQLPDSLEKDLPRIVFFFRVLICYSVVYFTDIHFNQLCMEALTEGIGCEYKLSTAQRTEKSLHLTLI